MGHVIYCGKREGSDINLIVTPNTTKQIILKNNWYFITRILQSKIIHTPSTTLQLL